MLKTSKMVKSGKISRKIPPIWFFDVTFFKIQLAYRLLIRPYRVEKWSKINSRTGTTIRVRRVCPDGCHITNYNFVKKGIIIFWEVVNFSSVYDMTQLEIGFYFLDWPYFATFEVWDVAGLVFYRKVPDF